MYQNGYMQQHFSDGTSSKQDDALFMNSLDIENIERYLSIKDDAIQKSSDQDQIIDEAEIGQTPYYLPLKEIHREKSHFREKLQSSINLFSRMMSPEAERVMKNLQHHLDNPSVEAYLSNQFDEDEIIDYFHEEPTKGKEEAFFAEIEKMLKSLENNTSDHPAFLVEDKHDVADIKETITIPFDVKQSAVEKLDNNAIKSNQNNLTGIHHQDFYFNEYPPNHNTIRNTAVSDRPEPEPEPEPQPMIIIQSKSNQKTKKGCQIF